METICEGCGEEITAEEICEFEGGVYCPDCYNEEKDKEE